MFARKWEPRHHYGSQVPKLRNHLVRVTPRKGFLNFGPLPLEVVMAVKALAHWLATCIPLALLAPVVGLLLNLEIAAQPVLVATLLAGTPAISFIGAIGAALTLRTRRGGLLLALLVLPLFIPTLIFGIATISAVITPPGDAWASFTILTAISLAAVVLGPVAAAAALRLQIQ